MLTFADAIKEAAEFTIRPHVLLENGFSIACRPDSFRYDALLNEATFDGSAAGIAGVFNLLGTTDFERVIEVLELNKGQTSDESPRIGWGPSACRWWPRSVVLGGVPAVM
jgi:hypothetical protein